jgi:hypothetical protein
MRYTKRSWLILMLVVSLILSACNFGQEPEPTPDVGAIFTAAAETVMAEFSLHLTQTALAAPPATATPSPTITGPATFGVVSPSPGAGSPAAPAGTPLATVGIGTQPAVFPTITSPAVLPTQGETCYNASFVTDVNYPDGAVVKRSRAIAKVWRIQNTGTCTWDEGFSLQHVGGEAMGGKAWVIDQENEFVKPGDTVDIQVEMETPSTPGEHSGYWRMQGDNGFYFGVTVQIVIVVE